jgi:hypothetical protein
MKSCPTSNMNRSQFWGFDVSHVIISFTVLAVTNVMLNIFKLPLILSWVFGLLTLGVLRVISHGQKNGHLELLARFAFQPHVYLGHAGRKKGEK